MGSWIRSVLLAAVASMSLGASSASQASDPSFAVEFGRSLPPIGFVKFCASNPGECKGVGRSVKRAEMTPERWSELYKINMRVNAQVTPVSDAELYGQAEHWAYPTDAGDCEDYLLLKKRELEAKGFSPSALLITVVLDEKNEGHAVLTVATDAGDYILDNRRNDILLWKETGYTFLKRQSRESARDWVALTTTKHAVKAVAGN